MEFGSIDFMTVVGDSVFVWDRRNERMVVVSADGEHPRHVPLPLGSFMIGMFEEGSVLVQLRERIGLPQGLLRIHDPYIRLNADGSSVSLGRFFRVETYWVPDGGDGVVDIGRLLAPRAAAVTHGDRWYYTNGSGYSLVQYGSTGQAEVAYVHPDVPPLVTDRQLARLLDERLRLVGPDFRFERELRAQSTYDRMPGYDRLMVDHDGNVWARLYSTDEARRCWHVYRPALVVEFVRACMPPRLDPLDIGSRAVLGVLRERLGVEQVAVYELVK
jgi:hypothetical protein